MSQNHPHDNIYNILGKLKALEPTPAETVKAKAQQIRESVDAQGSILKGLREVSDVEQRLSQMFAETKKVSESPGVAECAMCEEGTCTEHGVAEGTIHKGTYGTSYDPSDEEKKDKPKHVPRKGETGARTKAERQAAGDAAPDLSTSHLGSNPFSQKVVKQPKVWKGPSTKISGARSDDTTNADDTGDTAEQRAKKLKAKFKKTGKIGEVITKKTSAGDIIHDFQKSKNPKFSGKSKEQRKNQALGAYYGMHPEKSNKNEGIIGNVINRGKEAWNTHQANRQFDRLSAEQNKIAAGKTDPAIGQERMNAMQSQIRKYGNKAQAARLARTGSTLSKNSTYGRDQDAANIARLKQQGMAEMSLKESLQQVERKVILEANLKELTKQHHMTMDEMLECLRNDAQAYKTHGHMSNLLRDCMDMHTHNKNYMPALADEGTEKPSMMNRLGSAIKTGAKHVAHGVNKVVGHPSDDELLDRLHRDSVDGPDAIDQHFPQAPDQFNEELQKLAELAGLTLENNYIDMEEETRGQYIKDKEAESRAHGQHTAHAFGQDFEVDEGEAEVSERWDPVEEVKRSAMEYMNTSGIRSVHDLDAEAIQYIGDENQINYSEVCKILGCELPEELGPIDADEVDEGGGAGIFHHDAEIAKAKGEKTFVGPDGETHPVTIEEDPMADSNDVVSVNELRRLAGMPVDETEGEDDWNDSLDGEREDPNGWDDDLQAITDQYCDLYYQSHEGYGNDNEDPEQFFGKIESQLQAIENDVAEKFGPEAVAKMKKAAMHEYWGNDQDLDEADAPVVEPKTQPVNNAEHNEYRSMRGSTMGPGEGDPGEKRMYPPSGGAAPGADNGMTEPARKMPIKDGVKESALESRLAAEYESIKKSK